MLVDRGDVVCTKIGDSFLVLSSKKYSERVRGAIVVPVTVGGGLESYRVGLQKAESDQYFADVYMISTLSLSELDEVKFKATEDQVQSVIGRVAILLGNESYNWG